MDSPMRLLAAGTLLVFAAIAIAGGLVQGPTRDASFVLQPSAPTAGLALLTDHNVSGRGDAVAFLLWLNVSGSGQFQEVRVNLSLEILNGTDVATPLDAAAISEPGACVRTRTAASTLDWRCYGVRIGSYAWRVATSVDNRTEVGRWQNGTATALAIAGGSSSTLRSSAPLWIAGADLDLTVSSNPTQAAHAGDLIDFWINVTNNAENVPEGLEATAVAYNVSLTIILDPLLRLGPGSANLTVFLASLTAGSVIPRNIETIIAETAPPGSSIQIHILLTYQDFNLHRIGPVERASTPIYIALGEFASAPNLVAGAAIGLTAIVATLVVLVYVGQRKIVIDEAFLMHRSGALLYQASRAGTKKDEDLIASMFVAIQEFLRDSFAREAYLDEVSFGRRRAAVVRGDYVILAAILSRGEVEYLVPEMLAAVRAVETAYGAVLSRWDGRMAHLEGIERIVDRFLAGGFRGAWRARFA